MFKYCNCPSWTVHKNFNISIDILIILSKLLKIEIQLFLILNNHEISFRIR